MNKTETARKWLKQALHDLVMAEKNITIEGFDIAAFLSHQAVEKLLKALFIIQGQKPPGIHYIDEPAKMLNLSDELLLYIYELSADYTISRYPDASELVPYEHYDKNLAIPKVTSAQKIFELLKDSYREFIEDNYNA